jgi:superfamily II DNA or RNA helicase
MMVLPTGGGKSIIAADIASRATKKHHSVLILVHRRQLVMQMVERLREYGLYAGIIMSGEKTSLDMPIQVGTIQTYHRRLQLDDPGNVFFVDASVVIIDEAHRSLSKTYQSVLSLYKKKIVIGITATPCLASGVGMGQYY